MRDNFSYFEKDRTRNQYFFLFLSDPWLLLFENSIFSLLIWLIIISDANDEDGDEDDDGDDDDDEDGEGAWDNGDIGKY